MRILCYVLCTSSLQEILSWRLQKNYFKTVEFDATWRCQKCLEVTSWVLKATVSFPASLFTLSRREAREGTGERACDTSVYLFLFPLNHMTGYTLKENWNWKGHYKITKMVEVALIGA